MTITYGGTLPDSSWGGEFTEVFNANGIDFVKLCHVHVSQISKIAKVLSESVVDTSWMMTLDAGTRSSYEYTVQETAQLLVEIFKAAEREDSVVDEFGELMVSMGAAKALEVVFKHTLIPIAELWKPQAKQNEGFDFHSICPGHIINFGEAKYCSSTTSYGRALKQAGDFVTVKKHKRDRVHLVSLATSEGISNLDNNVHGVIAAFSIHADDQLTVYRNALKKAAEFSENHSVKFVYMIGVTHEG